MNKQDPNTHCFSVRCPMQNAAKVKTVADEKGQTSSEVIADMIKDRVKGVKPSKAAKDWAATRYAANLKRRKEADRKTAEKRMKMK